MLLSELSVHQLISNKLINWIDGYIILCGPGLTEGHKFMCNTCTLAGQCVRGVGPKL